MTVANDLKYICKPRVIGLTIIARIHSIEKQLPHWESCIGENVQQTQKTIAFEQLIVSEFKHRLDQQSLIGLVLVHQCGDKRLDTAT